MEKVLELLANGAVARAQYNRSSFRSKVTFADSELFSLFTVT